MLTSIRNISRAEQYVLHEGKREAISPNTARTVPQALANKFLEQCSPMVIHEQAHNTIIPATAGEATIWLYNTTGNPSYPDTINVPVFRNKRKELEPIPNPKYTPHTLKYSVGRGQSIKVTSEGQFTANLHPLKIAVPPYSRVSYPEQVAHRLLELDARSNLEHRGSLKKSRPPHYPEPNETWSLSDIKLYASLIDRELELDGIRGHIGTSDMTEDEVKLEWLKVLFFRIADPQYRLPTARELDEFKNMAAKKVSSAQPPSTSIPVPVKRGRGRPRKNPLPTEKGTIDPQFLYAPISSQVPVL